MNQYGQRPKMFRRQGTQIPEERGELWCTPQ
jgi:hypothetical protein